MKLKTSDVQTGSFYALECFNVCLSHSDWTTAQSVLGLYPSLNHLALRLYIHEVIYTFQDSLPPGDWLKRGHSLESSAGKLFSILTLFTLLYVSKKYSKFTFLSPFLPCSRY